ncbi:MAG: hypothetical protein QM723_22645 [Myxococcaceae bacterium]
MRRVFFALLVLAACGRRSSEIDAVVTLDLRASSRTTDPRLLSVGLDANVLLGGKGWVEGQTAAAGLTPLDLSSPRLQHLTQALAPAYLRIGGADADRVFFSDDDGTALPKNDTLRMTAARWDALAGFSQSTGLPLVYTLNAGLAPRDSHGAWGSDNAAALVRHAHARGDDVHHFELGYEPNGYGATFGPSFQLDGKQYAHDLDAARAMLDTEWPGMLLGAAQAAWWPTLGEPAPLTKDALDASQTAPDVVSWTWYPLESQRCAFQLDLAKESAFDDTKSFAAFDQWSAEVGHLQQTDAHDGALWLGGAGHARCGGEPGLSDRFIASLWWVDLIGRAAKQGHQVVVRDSLVGGDDGLLDQSTLDPNPDYWATLLFKKLMNGKQVDASSSNGRVLTYAQCTRGAVRSVTVVLINPDPVRSAFVTLAGETVSAPNARVFQITSPDPLSRITQLNGAPLTVGDDGRVPPLNGVLLDSAADGTVSLHLEARSYAFIVVPGVGDGSHLACP